MWNFAALLPLSYLLVIVSFILFYDLIVPRPIHKPNPRTKFSNISCILLLHCSRPSSISLTFCRISRRIKPQCVHQPPSQWSTSLSGGYIFQCWQPSLPASAIEEPAFMSWSEVETVLRWENEKAFGSSVNPKPPYHWDGYETYPAEYAVPQFSKFNARRENTKEHVVHFLDP